MKKIIISGSSKLEDKVKYWINFFIDKGYEILDYPKLTALENYKEIYSIFIRVFIVI